MCLVFQLVKEELTLLIVIINPPPQRKLWRGGGAGEEEKGKVGEVEDVVGSERGVINHVDDDILDQFIEQEALRSDKVQDHVEDADATAQNGESDGGINHNNDPLNSLELAEVIADTNTRSAKKTAYFKKKNQIAKGYLSYKQFSARLGLVSECLDATFLSNSLSGNVISTLDGNKVYSMLISLQYQDKGQMKVTSPMTSVMIDQGSNTLLMGENIINKVNASIVQYSIELDEHAVLYAHWKIWLNEGEMSSTVSNEAKTNILNKEIEKVNDMNKNKNANILGIDEVAKIMFVKNSNNYVNVFPDFESIMKLVEYLEDNNNQALFDQIRTIEKANNVKITVYIDKDNNINSNSNVQDNVVSLYFVIDKIVIDVAEPSHKKIIRTICKNDSVNAVNSLVKWNNNKYPYVKWIDTQINNTYFTREIGNITYHIENGIVLFSEKRYSFNDMLFPYNSKTQNQRIGAIDFETFGSELNGLGKLEVYAGGVALKDGYRGFYYINPDIVQNDLKLASQQVILKMFEDLFDYIEQDIKVRNNYTIYAHNLGRFDSVFLLRTLAGAGYKVQRPSYTLNGQWKDNDILSMKIYDRKRKLTIKLLDSYKLITFPLDKLLITYECDIKKGIFPHKFMNKNTLFYVGDKPDINFYIDSHKINDIKIAEYEKIPSQINIKEESLEYLEKDVLGLLEAMIKVSDNYFSKYNINITNSKTLPAISLNMYGQNFYHPETPNQNIKMIRGPLEAFIRKAYFGGNSQIFVDENNRIINEGYHYDINSQYPAAMKQSMPTGNPVFSTNTNLSYYKLGFVYALITPPDKETLPNLFIPHRHSNGTISCPRHPFYEYISTVELQQGLNYGYKAQIFCGVNFPDACDASTLFGEFVDTIFDEKKNSKNVVERSVAKLTLNSLYGKFGQKEQEYTIKLIEKDKVNDIIKTYHYSYLAEVSDTLALIKYGPRVSENIRRLYADYEKFNSHNDFIFTKPRGIPAAVQISAMIASFARASINPFKNLEGNIAIASNTDSLILKSPLPADVVGDKLGQFKLESKFINGVFVKPKLYCYEDAETGELIRKASGVDATKLSFIDYINLSKGQNVLTSKEQFNVNWKNLSIEVIDAPINLRGLDLGNKKVAFRRINNNWICS